ncbi:G-patch domain protein, putative [Cordyceps militaris CM01]|uniref:G-patch domain protein, putative n=1 Tax=Cordyceps militaris (strain CM01) TaxID=983644 RepID=G3JQ66_CORMM|nr:G-patch domain protein, putative [Cordyceps militaris CM01]EGX89317.1 G-patch domain protein, putative [Cordyceps militaris CM01]
MQRSQHSEESEEDEKDDIPLHHKRPFGAGLKRKRVEFVRAQDPDDYISTLPSTRPTSSVVGDLYASIVLGTAKPDGEAEADGAASTTQQPAPTCPVCSLAITTTRAAHEASLAHQARPKDDVLGVGAALPEKTPAQARADEEAREARRQLTAGERKARAARERARAARWQAEVYGRQDLDRYLKGDGKEWE